jgi:acyl carrier protein
MEQIIVNVWQEILGIDEISIHDNFFELGGNSLTALRMLSQLETVLGKKLPLSLFKAPTVKQLVNFISKEEGILR